MARKRPRLHVVHEARAPCEIRRDDRPRCYGYVFFEDAGVTRMHACPSAVYYDTLLYWAKRLFDQARGRVL